jgi:hypothetical protein
MTRFTASAVVLALLATVGAAQDGKKKDDKPAAAPAGNPCDVKKTEKGYYCSTCLRELVADDVRNGNCKKCLEKPIQIEYCVKASAPFFQADCHPNKKDSKPIS